MLYITERDGHDVRAVAMANGTLSVATGVLTSYGQSGYGLPKSMVQLHSPRGIYVDAATRRLYVADTGNHIVRVLDLYTGHLSTRAGVLGSAGRWGDGGPATSAQLISPRGVAVDATRQQLYVADTGNHAIRAVDLASGMLTTISGVLGSGSLLGDGTPASVTLLYFPYSVELNSLASCLYITEPYNHAVRTVDLVHGSLSTLAGVLGSPGMSGDGGPATSAKLHFPYDVALALAAQQLYVADAGNHAVRLVDLATGRLLTAAGVLGSSGRSGLA